MSTIQIKKESITNIHCDAIVNAANEGLWHGGGVCGYIFEAAGPEQLTKACSKIGHCDTGNAVITPGFQSKAKYIIHAVGPRYLDGRHHEEEQLYSCYQKSLELAKEDDCHTIAFPLISAGIFGYPKADAWKVALTSCQEWIEKNEDYSISVIFTILDMRILKLGEEIYSNLSR